MRRRPTGPVAGRQFWPAVCLLALVAFLPPAAATGASPASAVTGKNGLIVPRFVSLKAGRVNVRVGPGQGYRIAWVFTRSGLPVEVIQEFDAWRRVRDSDGSVGWVFQSLLSGDRTAAIAPWGSALEPIRAGSSPDATIAAYLEPGVVAAIETCRDGWCRLSGAGFRGWIEQDRLWGVYPDEEID